MILLKNESTRDVYEQVEPLLKETNNKMEFSRQKI